MKSRYANAGTLVDGNDQNRLKAHYIYDAFGNQLNTSFDNLPVPNPLRYRGNEGYLLVYGQDTLLSFSLYNAGARTYDTGTGRWLQADPIVGVLDDPMSFNRYLYCDADPVNNEDPSGLRHTENANGPSGPNGPNASRGPNAKKSRYCPGLSAPQFGCPEVEQLFADANNLAQYGLGFAGLLIAGGAGGMLGGQFSNLEATRVGEGWGMTAGAPVGGYGGGYFFNHFIQPNFAKFCAREKYLKRNRWIADHSKGPIWIGEMWPRPVG